MDETKTPTEGKGHHYRSPLPECPFCGKGVALSGRGELNRYLCSDTLCVYETAWFEDIFRLEAVHRRLLEHAWKAREMGALRARLVAALISAETVEAKFMTVEILLSRIREIIAKAEKRDGK